MLRLFLLGSVGMTDFLPGTAFPEPTLCLLPKSSCKSGISCLGYALADEDAGAPRAKSRTVRGVSDLLRQQMYAAIGVLAGNGVEFIKTVPPSRIQANGFLRFCIEYWFLVVY